MKRDITIDKIINSMEYATIYDFTDLWIKSNDAKISDEETRKEIHFCLDKMAQENLLTRRDNELQIRGGGVPVSLTPNGLEIKENGGWIKFLKRKNRTLIRSALGDLSNLGGTLTLITFIFAAIGGGYLWLNKLKQVPPELLQKIQSIPKSTPQLLDSASSTKGLQPQNPDSVGTIKN